MSFTLILLVQSISMLWFGSKIVKALSISSSKRPANKSGNSRRSKKMSSAGSAATGTSNRMQKQVVRMFKLISALAWCYLFAFFVATGAVFMGGVNTVSLACHPPFKNGSSV